MTARWCKADNTGLHGWWHGRGLLLAVVLGCLGMTGADGVHAEPIAFSDYRLLQEGMNQAQVQLRVGAPDMETVISTDYLYRRIWYYLPTPGTGGWLTTITFGANDTIERLERHRVDTVLSPSGARPGFREFSLLREGMNEAEVWMRMGPPDRRTTINQDRHYANIWYYLPTPGSGGWITTLQFDTEGRLSRIERER